MISSSPPHDPASKTAWMSSACLFSSNSVVPDSGLGIHRWRIPQENHRRWGRVLWWQTQIAVVVGSQARQLYKTSWLPASSRKKCPRLSAWIHRRRGLGLYIFRCTDSLGAESIQYASIWPGRPGQGIRCPLVSGLRRRPDWDQTIAELETAGRLDTTLIAVNITDSWRPGPTTQCCLSGHQPPLVAGLWREMSDPYNAPFIIPGPYQINNSQWIGFGVSNAAILFSRTTRLLVDTASTK